jgi:ankyrin repeat protein
MVRLVRALVLAAALVSAPATAQLYGSDGEAFVSAMREGQFSKALDLVEKPGSTVVNYRGGNGDAGLHIAVRNRDPNWVGFLLSRGADPNLGNADGDTPMILAARIGFSEGVARMLMHGARVDSDNDLGETALIVGVQRRQTGIVRMLLEAGADPDKTDHAGGYSARDYARRDSRSTEILKLIETVKASKKAAVGPVKP